MGSSNPRKVRLASVKSTIKIAILLGASFGLAGTWSVRCQAGRSKLSTTHSALGNQRNDQDKNASGHLELIEPGTKVGPLVLGDNREHILELFPPESQDQQWKDNCGTTLNWVDHSTPSGGGNVFVRFRDQKVFQIESASTRFHTIEGITTYDSPEQVQRFYKNLRAYVLLAPPVTAFGDRPLIFWIDKSAGIAFAFAYYQEEHKRYLYKIIVFRPNTNVCPEDYTTDSPKWRELAPYSLEPPDSFGRISFTPFKG
jgi:hypothetical protein